MQDSSPKLSGVELMIAVAVLGLLGAVAAPQLVRSDPGQRAVGLANQLMVLRTALSAYARDHDGRWPGAAGAAQLASQLCRATDADGAVGEGDAYPLGPYLPTRALPDNPYTGTNSVHLVDEMPTRPAGTAAWLYDADTGEIRANSPGTTPDGRHLFRL